MLNKELQKEFYDTVVKQKYPNLTLEHSTAMTSAVFRKLADHMSRGLFPKVRIKYFGVFQVYIKRASYSLLQTKARFKKELLEPKLYFEYKKLTEGYIKRSLAERSKFLKQPVPQELEDALLHNVEVEDKGALYYKYKQWLK